MRFFSLFGVFYYIYFFIKISTSFFEIVFFHLFTSDPKYLIKIFLFKLGIFNYPFFIHLICFSMVFFYVFIDWNKSCNYRKYALSLLGLFLIYLFATWFSLAFFFWGQGIFILFFILLHFLCIYAYFRILMKLLKDEFFLNYILTDKEINEKLIKK